MNQNYFKGGETVEEAPRVRDSVPELKRVEVKTYMADPVCTICTGYIDIPHRRRLLDVLNGIPHSELHVEEEFLKLTEARISSLDGGSEVTAQTVYLNKAKILFLKEVLGEDTRVLGEEVARRQYPNGDKLSESVLLLTQLFTLTGRLHYAKSQSPQAVFNLTPRFLALTDVNIYPAGGDKGENGNWVSFVALNKEQIIFAQEL